MTDGEGAELDPRFDPRFQRGYEPESPDPPELSDDRRPLVRPTAPDGLSSGGSGEPSTLPIAGRPARVIPRINPFIAMLWALSVLLVAGGGYSIVQASENPTARFVASIAVGDLFARTAWTVAPIALQLGLAAMVGLVVWHAIGWMRRHSRDDG